MRILLIFILLFTSKLEQKAYKVLTKYYNKPTFIEQVDKTFKTGKLYEVIGSTDKVFIGYSPSKFENFDYMVILDKCNKIKLVKILVYRENYGAEIGSTRWLRQFIGMEKPKTFVSAISGATISVNSLKYSLNNLINQL